MKKVNIIILLVALASFTGCLEVDDDFNVLSDFTAEIEVTFPGRVFNQDAGLVFQATGFANNPDVPVTMALEGGDESITITEIVNVEARGGLLNPNIGVCGTLVSVDQNVSMSGRSVDYSIPLDNLLNSGATCAQVIVAPNMFYEFRITVQLSNGEQIVTSPVRSQILE